MLKIKVTSGRTHRQKKIIKQIRVRTNSPEHSTIVLKITGKVRPRGPASKPAGSYPPGS
ncbi:MAG: hypothetical protein K9K62_00090 [Desulfobacteraceae bacterium]|nr:hypothetical protein [Desulfobacteraceae bacterium]